MLDYKNSSLAAQVFGTIEKKILNGDYCIGEVLNEAKLSQELGVSRTPVREAITMLTMESLLKQEAHGLVVVGIGEKDIREIYMVKEALEPYIVKLAAEKINNEYLDKLDEIVNQQEFYLQRSNYDKIVDLDTQFHNTIYKIADSPILTSVLSPVHSKLAKYRKISVATNNRGGISVSEHRKIYEAFKEGRGDLASKYMEEHIQNAKANTLGGFK